MKRNENFGHPGWDHLSQNEKIEWLQKRIDECLGSDGRNENDRFLEQCFEELDRLTPELSIPATHTEARLQQILSSSSRSAPRHTPIPTRRPIKRLVAILIACAMLALMTFPTYAIMQEVIRYNPNISDIADDIRFHAVNYGESLLPLEKQLVNKEKRITQNDPYRITYHSLDDFLSNENFEIDYPRSMPEQYRIKYITVHYKNEEAWTIDFRFYGQLVEGYRITRAKYQNSNYGKTSATELYEINGITVYIFQDSDRNGKQLYHAYYTKNNIRYDVSSTNRNMLNILLEHTFGTPSP